MELIKGQKSAILVEPSSLVGHYCLEYLLEHKAYELVLVFSEKAKKREHPKLKWVRVNYDKLDTLIDHVKGHDLFWCRSSFKDWEDITDVGSIRESLPFKFAWAALQNNVSQFLFLSSVLIGKSSWLPVLKQRIELEKYLKELPFWAIHVFKPPLMVDQGPASRWGEGIAQRISDLMGGVLDNYRPLEAEVVARAMVDSAQQFHKGLVVFSAEDLQKLAEQFFPKSPRKM